MALRYRHLVWLLGWWCFAAHAEQEYHFSIPAMSADKALTEFARQANTTLLFPSETLRNIQLPPLEGVFSLQTGLRQLVANTPLEVNIDASGFIAVRPQAPKRKVVNAVAVRTDTEAPKNVVERIAIVGSRHAPRSVLSSPVPTDVIGRNELMAQGDTDVLSMMATLIPSLNVNDQPINDAASLVRPANLRGLAADHTLIMVNGKRRHRSAVITFLGGGLSDGAQGPDVSVLPAAAMQQVEVLRDGASAQYGSDAIAGVLNFVLDNSDSGGHMHVRTGTFAQGDGEWWQVQANKGMKLAEQGFLNLTAEYRQQNGTSRSDQRADAAALIAAGNPFIPNPAQIWGSLAVEQDIKLLANAGYDISPSHYLYHFTHFARRELSGGFYFRHPQRRVGVFVSPEDAQGRQQLLVADNDGPEGIACPTITVGDENLLVQPEFLQIADNSTAIGRNCFAFNEWFPGGFRPEFGGRITDMSSFTGVQTSLANGWWMDTSLGLGYSNIAYTLSNTVNPSLGEMSPTEFSPGEVSQIERTFNLDVRGNTLLFGDKAADIGFGVEWRSESYHQGAGELASYQRGPFLDFGVGSNGFPGYRPESAGHWTRSNWAFYADIELALASWWQSGVAARMERFSDFGGTFDGKWYHRIELNAVLALRGSISSGFKAPTVGQSNVINITTAFGAAGLEDQATLPPSDPISQQLGAVALRPEESINRSIGLAAEWTPALSMTLDYFHIDLRDRISTTSAIRLTPAEAALFSFNSVKYFTNDFDTRTRGLDAIVHYRQQHNDWQHDWVLAYNWTKTDVTRASQNLTPQRVRMLEGNLPQHRFTMTAAHYYAQHRLQWRLNYFGSFYEDHLDAAAGFDIYAGAEWTLDTEWQWQFSEGLTLTVGAKNLLDNQPDRNPFNEVVGARYPVTAPMGMGGLMLYAGLGMALD